jgi:hypothetical protein
MAAFGRVRGRFTALLHAWYAGPTFRGHNAKVLRRNRYVLTVAAFLTLNAALWFATAAFSLPRTLMSYLLGPKMIRGEIALKDGNGVLHDYRLDAGRIKSIDRVNTTVTLKERDGQVVTVPIGTSARITINGKPVGFGALRVRMQAQTLRDHDNGAHLVFATRVK